MTKEKLIEALAKAVFRYAKTMPKFPHWYTLRKDWESDKEFDAAVWAIRKHGRAGRFQGRNYVYFDEGDYSYWTMGSPVNKTILINKARKAE
jgi:hypothetical protein